MCAHACLRSQWRAALKWREWITVQLLDSYFDDRAFFELPLRDQADKGQAQCEARGQGDCAAQVTPPR